MTSTAAASRMEQRKSRRENRIHRLQPVVDQVVSRNSKCVAVDLTFNDGTTLRESGAYESRGTVLTLLTKCDRLTVGLWNKIVVPLGVRLRRSCHHGSVDRLRAGAGTGGFRGYVDDVSI